MENLKSQSIEIEEEWTVEKLLRYSSYLIRRGRYGECMDDVPYDDCWVKFDGEFLEVFTNSYKSLFGKDPAPLVANLINRHPTGDLECGNWMTAASCELLHIITATPLPEGYPLYNDDIVFIPLIAD